MHHPTHMPRSSAILSASSVFEPDLGELPDSIVELMALPEAVKKVQVSSGVMFHWAAKPGRKQNDLRGDTGTYQWVAKSARAVICNPYALIRGKEPEKYQIIGRVEPPSSRYQTIKYFRLVLKYVPGQGKSRSGELWVSTWNAHSEKSVARYLRQAVIVGI